MRSRPEPRPANLALDEFVQGRHAASAMRPRKPPVGLRGAARRSWLHGYDCRCAERARREAPDLFSGAGANR